MARWFKRSKKNKNETEEQENTPPLEEIEDSEQTEQEDAASRSEDETPAEAEALGTEVKADGEPVGSFVFDESSSVSDLSSDSDQEEYLQSDPEESNNKKGFLSRLKDRLSETRAVLTTRVDHLVLGVKEIDDDIIDDLEEILITSDLGVQTSQVLIEAIGKRIARRELDTPDRLKEVLREEIQEILMKPKTEEKEKTKPHVILVVGVNGVGKTTTLAKLANRHVKEGKKVMLVAADTFRAAAIDQLEIWSQRVGADIVRQQPGADPSAVVFDALNAAGPRDIDIVMIDTAGRMHTSTNLMDELKKVKRIAAREMPGAPHEVLMVLDATTGQNAVNQARVFNEAVGVTGLAMTKLDGTAKGGILVAISHELELPVKYIGIGEQMDDLADFDVESFVTAIFGG